MDAGFANYEAQYHPSAPLPPRPRDDVPHLPRIASARTVGEKKRAAARARARPGEGPAVVWVDSALPPPRFGKPLEKPAVDQVFAAEASTMHISLQRAGVEVASFLDETAAASWAAEQAHRVVCACLQLGSRDMLIDSDAVARMIIRYTSRGLAVVVVQPTSPVPTAKDAQCVRVCKRVCNDSRVPLFLDTASAMRGIMERVAKSYAFVNGRLQRVAVEDEQDEVSAPSRVDSQSRPAESDRETERQRDREAQRERVRRPLAPDPLPPQADVDDMLGIGIIEAQGFEPEPAALPRAPRFMRPRDLANAAANRRHAAAAAADLDGETQLDLALRGARKTHMAGESCARCELLKEQLDLVQAGGSQNAARLEAQLQSLQEAKDDQEQVLGSRIVALEKQAVTGSRKQEVALLEQQLVQVREAAEAKEKQIIDAAKAEKAQAIRLQKFKMARYLTELSDHKTLVESLKEQIASLNVQLGKQKTEGNAAVRNKDEEAISLAMQLADLEVEKGEAEERVTGLEAALAVEKNTIAALRTRFPPAVASSSAAVSPEEYIEAVEGTTAYVWHRPQFCFSVGFLMVVLLVCLSRVLF